jgi:hypothetical protein
MNWILVLLFGAPAFGLEAMFLGLGGKVFVLYRKKKYPVLLSCVGLGVLSVLPPLVISKWLSLGILETCLVLALSIGITGGALSLFSGRIKGGYEPQLPAIDRELERLKNKIRISEEPRPDSRET